MSNRTIPSASYEGNGLKESELLGVLWSFGTCALLTILARLWTRCFKERALGWDDLLLGFLGNALVAMGVVLTISGYNEKKVRSEATVKASFLFWVASIGQGFLSWAFKLVVLQLIGRIFNVPRLHRFLLYAALTVLLGLAIGQTVTILTFCTPAGGLWNPLIHAVCNSNHELLPDIAEAFSSFTAFLDVVLALYPLLHVFGVNTRRETKLASGLLMVFSALAAIMAIAKAATIFSYDNADNTVYSTSSTLFGFLELFFLVYASCVPALGPLFERPEQKVEDPDDLNLRISDALRPSLWRAPASRYHGSASGRTVDSIEDEEGVDGRRSGQSEGLHPQDENVRIRQEYMVSSEQRRFDPRTGQWEGDVEEGFGGANWASARSRAL